VQVGGEGVTEAVVGALTDAFNTRELVKVKVAEGAPIDAREAADELAGRVADVHVAQVIGRTIVVYRPFPEDPEIQLPR
jgi:RNA-binding protein